MIHRHSSSMVDMKENVRMRMKPNVKNETHESRKTICETSLCFFTLSLNPIKSS
jgi:hypothetical protein